MKSLKVRSVMGLILIVLTAVQSHGQNEVDGIMMGKKLYCTALMAGTSSWSEYWEGASLRVNQNIGTVRTTMVGPMASLGLGKNFNLLVNLPYVSTKASAGQLKGMHGVQDLSVWGKYRLLRTNSKYSQFAILAIGGFSIPSHDYVKDYLPLSIGLGSKTITLRGMLDYEYRHVFATVSGSFIGRSDIFLDRASYYTTQLINSSRVSMPPVSYTNVRLGYRNPQLIAEVIGDRWETLGGFDITKNNMPFPSNRMIQTRVGFNGKYEPAKWNGIALLSTFHRTLSGRNIGKSTSVQLGFLYTFMAAHKAKHKTN